GIIGVMRMTTANSADPLRRKQALMIAEGLLEEVRAAAFTICDPNSPNIDTALAAADCDIPEAWGQAAPEPVNPRPFDNVNDYVPRANADTAAFDTGGVLTNAAGTALGVQGYTARVNIAPVELFGVGGAGASADANVLRIRVTVAFDAGQSVVLDGYRMRYSRPGF
ncbi:MAG: type II secretion system protein, partial [Telluria sp.]